MDCLGGRQAGASGRLIWAPFIALSGLTSWLMFLLTRRLFGATPAVWATLAFNLAGFFTVAAGAWILPDGPLNLWLLAAALALAAILFPAPDQTGAGRWLAWLAFGCCLGFAGLSKYQAVLFGVGVAIYFLTTRDPWRDLLDPAPFFAAALALCMITPVILWNAQHGWASFRFQGARGGVHHGPEPLWVLVAIAGQMAVLLPWIYAPLVVAAVDAARRGPQETRRWFCVMLGAPSIVLFSLTPLWGERALPHWPMSGWLMIFPVLGAWLADKSRRHAWPRRWAWASTFATLGLWALAASETEFGWIGWTIPTLHRDPTLETVTWTGLRAVVLHAQAARPGCLFVAALNWRDGGKIGAAVGDLAPVRVYLDDPRGFAFLTAPKTLQDCDALVFGSTSDIARQSANLRGLFTKLEPYGSDTEGRNGTTEVTLGVLLGRRLLQPLPAAYASSLSPPRRTSP